MVKAPPGIDDRLLKLLHHRASELKRGESVGLPITHTSTYYVPGAPEADYTYTRDGNPTWSAVENQLSILEDAPAVAFPSGMGAIAAVLYTQLRAGDRIVLPSDGYYVVRALVEEALLPMGVTATFWPTSDYANAPVDDAKLIWIETPSNPGLDVCDLDVIARRANAAGAITVADNTTLTPLLQSPLDLGVDVIASSDTKAMAGHGDVLFGHVASRNEQVIAGVKRWRKLAGSIPGPAETALVHRGLETADVRLARMCETAGLVAARLVEHPKVQAIRYPGLQNDPSYEIACRQMRRFGFLIGFTLADAQTADTFLEHCKAAFVATSFGSVHTSAERRARWGDNVPDGFIRLSVGCEPAEALWSEIERALKVL